MKKLFHLLIIILLTSAIWSCRSPKQMTQETDVTVRKDSNVTTEAGSERRLDINKEIKKIVDVIDRKISELNWEYTRTDYSSPDSTGKQHPTHMETGKLNKKTDEDSRRNEQTETQYKIIASYLTTVSQRIESMENRQEHIEAEYKEKLTWYQSALIYLGGLFVVYIILTIYIKLKKP